MGKITRIHNGKIVEGSASVVLPSETSARENRQGMRTKHRKELLQKNQVDYWKVHPDQAEKELPPETRRLLS